jgi:multidrug efflux pump subunit AcrA (membrane-fusion protein)
MVTYLPLMAITAALLVGQPESRPVPLGVAPGTITVHHCEVTLVEESQVAAKEPGVLVDVPVKEGQQVASGQLLAQIDDAKAQMETRAAVAKLDVARETAVNDVKIRYAKKAAGVAEMTYRLNLEANQKVTGSVPRTEVERLRLEWERSLLEIEQNDFQHKIDGMDMRVRQAELDGANEEIERRKVRAPIDGVVVELKRHRGEWVAAGDTLLRLLRMDRLRIKGFINAKDYAPAEVVDRPVTVTVMLAHDRQETFTGKIRFVSPQLELGGDFRIYAEVLNRQENDQWLLRPGLIVDMTISLQ